MVVTSLGLSLEYVGIVTMTVIGVWVLSIVSSGEHVQGDVMALSTLLESSLLSGRGRLGPPSISKNGLAVIKGFVILKPASATVVSRFSGKWEGLITVYNRYSSFLVPLPSTYLSCASLRYDHDCVGMLTTTITGC